MKDREHVRVSVPLLKVGRRKSLKEEEEERNCKENITARKSRLNGTKVEAE